MKNLMEYSLLEAAKAARVNKSTVLRAIKSGRLSAGREEGGTYRIDASELARVFDLRHLATVAPQGAEGAMPQAATSIAPSDAPSAPPLDMAVEVAVLRAQVLMLEAERERWDRERDTMLGAHRETVDDLRRRLDQEQEERRNLQRQLAPPVQPTPLVPQEQYREAPRPSQQSKPVRDFLGRLLGR